MTGRKTPWTAAAVGLAVLKALPGLLLVQVGVTTLMTGPGQWLWDTDADAQSATDLVLLVVGGALILAGALTVAASVLRLGGWMIGLGIGLVWAGAVGFALLMIPPAAVLLLPGVVLMIIGMKRSWDAQGVGPSTLVEANAPVVST